MDLKKLANPFRVEDLEFRIGRAGMSSGKPWAVALTYITSRAIHDRLDEVCGPANWQLRYKEHLGGTVCEIGILFGGEWIWKAGGSESTQIEAFKGGLSGAEKRAGVPWGIGRYLYKLTEIFVQTTTEKNSNWNYQGANKQKQIPVFWWQNPPMPEWALPQPEKEDSGKLAYELDLLLSSEGKDMTDNEKLQIAKFYCISCEKPVVELHEMSGDMLADFTAKVDVVFDAFVDSLKDK